MDKLSSFSDEELLEEVKRREAARLEMPQINPNIDWEPVISYVKFMVHDVAMGEGAPKDYKHWLFETVIEAMYSPGFWKWWNDKQ